MKPLSEKPDISEIVIPVHKEEATVTRRVVPGDVVRVGTVTEQHEQVIDEPLTHERVEVEHVPVGREIEAMPGIIQDGDVTIIPIVEEIVVVQRRLRLKEELHVRRVRETSRHQQTVLLREQKAVVTRSPGTTSHEGAPASDENNA